MFKTPYKSIYRVHSVEEALQFEIGEGKTDMLLYFVDLYDVLLSIRSGLVDKPSLHQILELRMKCTEYLLKNYHTLYKPIPGVLLGWTTSLLLFIIILHLVHLQYEGTNMYLTEKNKAYIKEHRLRIYTFPEPEEWCFATYISFMDVIAFRWKKLTPNDQLNEILELCWRLASKLMLNMHSKIILNVESFRESIKGKPDYARLSEKAMIMCMSRFYWFVSTFNYMRRWKKASSVYAPTVESTNWAKFIVNEKRHFITRRFRDGILTVLFDKIILYGDKEIASHNQLGEDVSSMTCLYQRAPAGQLNKLQKMITYDEYEDIIKYEPIKDWIHLIMLNQHFVSTFNIKFISFFFISEERLYKHIKAVERSVVPLIFYRFNGFVCFYEGKIYEHPDGKSIEHAFVLWCHMLRSKCNSRAFSMDFTPLLTRILDVEVEVDNSRDIDGMFELEDD